MESKACSVQWFCGVYDGGEDGKERKSSGEAFSMQTKPVEKELEMLACLTHGGMTHFLYSVAMMHSRVSDVDEREKQALQLLENVVAEMGLSGDAIVSKTCADADLRITFYPECVAATCEFEVGSRVESLVRQMASEVWSERLCSLALLSAPCMRKLTLDLASSPTEEMVRFEGVAALILKPCHLAWKAGDGVRVKCWPVRSGQDRDRLRRVAHAWSMGVHDRVKRSTNGPVSLLYLDGETVLSLNGSIHESFFSQRSEWVAELKKWQRFDESLKPVVPLFVLLCYEALFEVACESVQEVLKEKQVREGVTPVKKRDARFTRNGMKELFSSILEVRWTEPVWLKLVELCQSKSERACVELFEKTGIGLCCLV
jgi:hypothetical protein